MARTPHFQSTADWPAVKSLWLEWKHGNRPDLKNLQALASEAGVPYATLTKKTPRWKREIEAELVKEREALEQKEATLGGKKAGGRRQRRSRTGDGGNDRLSAGRPSETSDLNQYSDTYRQARKIAQDHVAIAVQGLVEEIQQGTGASRITAIRELMDRAGLAKETEKKDEASPYESEGREVLFKRWSELMKSYDGWEAFIEKEHQELVSKSGTHTGSVLNPTTLSGPPATDFITPVPTSAQNTSGIPDRSKVLLGSVLPKASHPPLPPTPGCVEVGTMEVKEGITIHNPLG